MELFLEACERHGFHRLVAITMGADLVARRGNLSS
jgi:hypothetical protein